MGNQEIFNLKKKSKDLFVQNNKLSKNKILGLVLIDDSSLEKSILEGLGYLPINFVFLKSENISNLKNIITVPNLSNDDLYAFDFLLCDDYEDKILEYLKFGITPIVNRNNYLDTILKEFNSMQNEGNAFLYNEFNKWDIFYALVRYSENYKYPYDNKNLVKNVLQIQ